MHRAGGSGKSAEIVAFSKPRGVAQSGRVPALGAGCRWFESSRPDQPVGDSAEVGICEVEIGRNAGEDLSAG